MLIFFVLKISYNMQMYRKSNLFSQRQKKGYRYIICVKNIILVPTEEIVVNCSYILRILINYGILRGILIFLAKFFRTFFAPAKMSSVGFYYNSLICMTWMWDAV